MTKFKVFQPSDSPHPVAGSELERVLDAWNSATERLQKTHDALRGEVRRLADELEVKNRELARKNRLIDLGQMASHVAHEVRNGLAPLTLYLSLLRRRVTNDDAAVQTLDKIDAGVTALEATVADLLSFASDRDPARRRFSLAELLSEVCQSLAPQLGAQKIAVEIDTPLDLEVFVDRDMMRRAVLNLVLNALDVMPQGGQLVLTGIGTPHGFELEVADSGGGIKESVRERIFEPFFTTKSEGTGLGLAIVYRIAEVHGGTVQAANCPEGGAAITLRIPYRAREAAA
jgi:signal transduction histidine kinase